MTGTSWLALALVAAGLKACWRDLFKIGPADSGSPLSPEPEPSGADLFIDDCVLVTPHGVELEIGDTDWTLDEVCGYIAWIDSWPETVEVA